MLKTLWDKTASLPFWEQLLLKFLVFCLTLLFVLFPNPFLLLRQVENYWNMESLIQTDFHDLDTINREIDALLYPETSPKKEVLVIQKYVYRHIRYEYDWKNWGNIDFWPTAGQVWERKREDCDGRAILAASILRSRGFASASLVGSIRHLWVDIERRELLEPGIDPGRMRDGKYGLMGPDREQHIRREGNKLILTLPSLDLFLGSMAIYVAEFPTLRNLLLLLISVILLYHPCKNLAKFLGITILGLVGFLLLKDWAHKAIIAHVADITANFVGGCAFLGITLFFSFVASNITIRHRHL